MFLCARAHNSTVTLKLLRKHHITGNIWTFVFEPETPLSWTAGQFIRVGLPHSHPDLAGTSRRFTISSAPHEGAVHITTRLSASSFKQALAALPVGGELQLLDEPAGDFVWQDSARPLVFVAQGIGITPFFSLLKDRAHRGLPLGAELFYSSRHDTPAAFTAELQAWAAAPTGLTFTQQAEPFTAARLADLIPDLPTRLVYVSGPTSMIGLLVPPISLPARRLKQDTFSGYDSATY